jgi:hypothetical protein
LRRRRRFRRQGTNITGQPNRGAINNNVNFFYRLGTRLDALGVAKDFASSNPLKKLGIAANRIIRFFPLLHFRAEFKEGCTVESYKISDLIKMMIFLAFVLLCNANNGIRIFFK